MSWRFRTATMFIAITFLLIIIGFIIGYLFADICTGILIMLAISISLNMFSYFYSKRMTLSLNKVRLVSYNEEPRLYKIVQGLVERSGLPMPEVGISDLLMPNAFATGHNQNDATVVATRQLLNMLNDDELEGVMAHELSHIKNRDVLVMSLASTMASIVAFSTRMAVWASIFNDRDDGLPLIVSIIADITMPIAAIIIQLGVSRNREYFADESGARLTGKPMALASALITIEKGCSETNNTYNNLSTSNLWISNPFGREKRSILINFFRTHPSTEDRIKRLKNLDEEINGYTHY